MDTSLVRSPVYQQLNQRLRAALAAASALLLIGGLSWSWCYQKYRSIWPGYLSHLLVDASIFWIGWQILS